MIYLQHPSTPFLNKSENYCIAFLKKTSDTGTHHSNMVLNYIGDTVQQQLKSIVLVFKQGLVVI